MSIRKNLGESYKPAYFLAALGNGGLTTTFYMFLHFLVPHKDAPMAIFPTVKAELMTGTLPMRGMIVFALLGILIFAFRHYRALLWNLREYRAFKKTQAFADLQTNQTYISLSAIPLTLAMAINVFFIVGAVFVPGLWNLSEILLPAALAMFLAVGVYAMRIFVAFASHNLTTGTFDCSRNNSLSQLIAIFAFAMVAVGLAAPAAMSQNVVTSVLGMIGSIFFLSATIIFGAQQLVLGFRSMLEHGIDRENSPSLWIVVPIMTLIGIAMVRLSHGLHVNLDVHASSGEMFVMLATFISIQILFGIIGYVVMKQVGYFKTFVNGAEKHAGSYALICPGVALTVFGWFFIHMGLVKTGVVDRFSIAHFVLLAPVIYLQFKTIFVMLKLDRKLLKA
jgi:hypothetical protein